MTVEELWYFVAGRGRMWRKDETGESVVEVYPGLSLDIPVGTAFQFRADGDSPLEAVGITMPPWPGPHEAIFVDGAWPPTA
jgi:mannose-6-phosphate isomerase-like protein (cupin superfamily)